MTTSISHLVIRMYKLGTGDCFLLKFMSGEQVACKMLIDCGCWTRPRDEILPFVQQLLDDAENHLDVLVVTHEHTDHVLGFEAAEALFTANNVRVDQIWMGWPENDLRSKVKKWKTEYGEKKKALALAAKKLQAAVESSEFRDQFAGAKNSQAMLGLRRQFSSALADFAGLQLDAEDMALSESELRVAGGSYKGSLKGMAVVKKELVKKTKAKKINFFTPGDVLKSIPGLDGVRIFVLGPPEKHAAVSQEHGGKGESFEHNEHLKDADLFARALIAHGARSTRAKDGDDDVDDGDSELLPFDKACVSERRTAKQLNDQFFSKQDRWRRIDFDWLFSSGAFALRMNSLTNNLSLALAFEFGDGGKVALFPGDAEFGSWNSWHDVRWEAKAPGVTTKDLLSRVAFYKVAHHLSHNGTAKAKGLDLMTSPDLAAMATLDYNVIAKGWRSTMPNRLIVKQLLEKTKGRLMITNLWKLDYALTKQADKPKTKTKPAEPPDPREPLADKIAEYRELMTLEERKRFREAVKETDKFIEYTLTI